MALGRDMSRSTLLPDVYEFLYPLYNFQGYVYIFTHDKIVDLREGKGAFLNFRFKEGIWTEASEKTILIHHTML